jgi:hypothetical protein
VDMHSPPAFSNRDWHDLLETPSQSSGEPDGIARLNSVSDLGLLRARIGPVA